LEFFLADLQQVDRKIERLTRQVKGDKKLQSTLDLTQALHGHLDSEQPISRFTDQDSDEFQALTKEMRFLTSKPVIYVANVDEDGLAEENEYVQAVRELAAEQGAEMVILCAKLEEEMIDLTEEERQEFLELAGATESGLDQVVRKSFKVLGLITYFTMNEKEVRAWTIPQGWTAPRAAGVIHTDFERGFIRAEVIPYDTYVQYGSGAAAKAAGAMQLEGKDYVVQDGDVIYFRFNV
jgi:GTP-binding protein YchF